MPTMYGSTLYGDSIGLTLVTAPGSAAVTLPEMKTWLRIEDDDTSQDQVVESLEESASKYIEEMLGRQLITATWKYTLDTFPDDWVIRLPRPPLVSVSSLVYIDTGGNSVTWSSSLYTVDALTEPGRLTPAWGQVWPVNRPVAAAVAITYVAGYGNSGAVPEGIKTAIKLLAANWYENREPSVVGTISHEVQYSLDTLLAQYWPGTYF